MTGKLNSKIKGRDRKGFSAKSFRGFKPRNSMKSVKVLFLITKQHKGLLQEKRVELKVVIFLPLKAFTYIFPFLFSKSPIKKLQKTQISKLNPIKIPIYFKWANSAKYISSKLFKEMFSISKLKAKKNNFVSLQNYSTGIAFILAYCSAYS